MIHFVSPNTSKILSFQHGVAIKSNMLFYILFLGTTSSESGVYYTPNCISFILASRLWVAAARCGPTVCLSDSRRCTDIRSFVRPPKLPQEAGGSAFPYFR